MGHIGTGRDLFYDIIIGTGHDLSLQRNRLEQLLPSFLQ
jgi:hypothetical protein